MNTIDQLFDPALAHDETDAALHDADIPEGTTPLCYRVEELKAGLPCGDDICRVRDEQSCPCYATGVEIERLRRLAGF